MATTTTIAVFFLLLTLTSTTIHARESQFFAKVSNTPKDSLPLNNNNNNNPQINTNQQDPTFVPQTEGSGFGLYGHESGQLPPADTTTITTTRLPANLPANYNPVAYTTPIHSSTQDIPNEYNYEPQAFNNNNNNNGETKMYSSQSQDQDEFMDNGKYYYAPENTYNSNNFDDAKFMETENGGNMYNIPKQGENDMYNPQSQGNLGEEAKYVATNNNNNMYNIPGKQGMSDTRFLENGKYYYDLDSERLNVNNNANMNSRGVRNGFETQGYYSDNQNPQGYYDNSQNSYDRYNTNGGGGYQNQEFTP
uniref:protein E6 n=1 Tax=Erigeron canadensis TaxID=72917 RepID=UPI001CB97ADF|nr:protein E6 [Erigeron canadensis]